MHLDPYECASYAPLKHRRLRTAYDKLDTMWHLVHQLVLRAAATHQDAAVIPV